jgi:hypothetical protein
VSSARVASWCGASVLALTALGCGKTGQNGGPSPPAEAGAQADGAAGAAAGGAAGGTSAVAPEACLSPQPGPSPLLRLSDVQLTNTLRDLFHAAPAVFDRLAPELALLSTRLDAIVAPFSSALPGTNASEPDSLRVQTYHRLAHTFASELSRDPEALQAFVGCNPAEAGEETCRQSMLQSFLLRAYRRQPTEQDLTEMREVFATGQALGGDFASGVRAVVEVVLQGPDLLYMVEQGAGEAQGEVVALSPYESATRLAYFLTGHPPDTELLAAAAAGELSEATIEAQARRLLGTPPSRRLMRSFMENLLDLGLSSKSGSPEYPRFTAAIEAMTLEETGRFVESVTFDGAGTFEALFSESTTWVNTPLAQFYGLPLPGAEFGRVQLDAEQRAGVLTQAAFLSAHSRAGQTSPAQRGVAVLDRLLCRELPRPPAGSPVELPPPLQSDATMRERLLSTTAEASCQECHRDIDPIGLAFENYDPVGLWRDVEHGRPIDASGSLLVSDAQGSFVNAVGLIRRIAASKDARSCFAGHWLAYAYGRSESPADVCAREAIEAALETSGGNVVELLVALAKTDQLRYRLKSELAP